MTNNRNDLNIVLQVIMKNTGDIDAVFYYVQSQSLFGQQFDFTPAEGIIKPGGYQAIQVLP